MAGSQRGGLGQESPGTGRVQNPWAAQGRGAAGGGSSTEASLLPRREATRRQGLPALLPPSFTSQPTFAGGLRPHSYNPTAMFWELHMLTAPAMPQQHCPWWEATPATPQESHWEQTAGHGLLTRACSGHRQGQKPWCHCGAVLLGSSGRSRRALTWILFCCSLFSAFSWSLLGAAGRLGGANPVPAQPHPAATLYCSTHRWG